MPDPNIYDSGFVQALFDEMSRTYGITNLVASLGFCQRWRRQAVEGIAFAPSAQVLELMSGSGECWPFIATRLSAQGALVALDLSSEMCRRALDNRRRFAELSIEVKQGDALASGLEDASADHVVACFGLKTFSNEQLALLAREVWRLLKPGGTFSFVEIAMPRALWLRAPYVFYLRLVIPALGRVFLGNPDNYRLLAVYTERFGGGDHVRQLFERQGFEVRAEDLFFGCARRLVGARGELGAPLLRSESQWSTLKTLLFAFVMGALASAPWQESLKGPLLAGACSALAASLLLWVRGRRARR